MRKTGGETKRTLRVFPWVRTVEKQTSTRNVNGQLHKGCEQEALYIVFCDLLWRAADSTDRCSLVFLTHSLTQSLIYLCIYFTCHFLQSGSKRLTFLMAVFKIRSVVQCAA